MSFKETKESHIFYSGQRRFLLGPSENSCHLEPPSEFKTVRQARRAASKLPAVLSAQLADGKSPACMFLSALTPASKFTQKTAAQRRTEALRKFRNASKLRGNMVFFDTSSSLKTADWTQETQAGVRMWVNHSTGEVLSEHPRKHAAELTLEGSREKWSRQSVWNQSSSSSSSPIEKYTPLMARTCSPRTGGLWKAGEGTAGDSEGGLSPLYRASTWESSMDRKHDRGITLGMGAISQDGGMSSQKGMMVQGKVQHGGSIIEKSESGEDGKMMVMSAADQGHGIGLKEEKDGVKEEAADYSGTGALVYDRTEADELFRMLDSFEKQRGKQINK